MITGGSRGIGFTLANALAAQGARIGLIDVLEDVADSAQKIVDTHGVTAAGVVADVTDAAALDAAFDTLAHAVGTADILVTSAGITLWGDSVDVTPEQWQRVHARWEEMIPAQRMGEPEDLIGVVILLASSESGYLTGQSIVVDGGYTAI